MPELCDLVPSHGPVVELHEARDVPLGGVRAMRVRRTLPQRALPLVGAWCFLDEFGPQHVDMRVLPHPHTGLQTVTWPVAGEILHRDSVGSEAVVRPGQLNLMTAGHGVSHSEFSLGAEPLLHAVQLWVALPDGVAAGRRRVRAGERPARLGGAAGAGDGVHRRPRRHLVAGARAHAAARRGGRAGRARRHRDPAGPRLRARRAAPRRDRARSPGTPHTHQRAALPRRRPRPRAGPVARRRPAPAARRRAVRARPRDVVELRRPHARRHRPGTCRLGVRRTARTASGSSPGHDGARIPAPELPNIRLQPRRRLPRTPKEPS